MDNVERVYIPQDDDFASLSLGDLESIASGLQSDSGISLNSSVKEFLNASARARGAQNSAEEAEENSALVAYALFQHLVKDRFQVQMLACKGFTGKLRECSPLMEQAIREIGAKNIADDLIHFAVRVGNIVLDLGYRRLGSEYLNSNNTVFNQFKNFWKSIDVLSVRQLQNQNSFLVLARTMASNTHLRKTIASIDKDRKTQGVDSLGGTFGMVTASSVVNAFEGAKRNRKTRVIEKGKGGKPNRVRI